MTRAGGEGADRPVQPRQRQGRRVGADVHCDTQLILRTLERLHPEPSLFPDGTEGIATVVAWWADKFVFVPALDVTASVIADRLTPEFVAERRAFGFPFAREDVAPLLHRHLQQAAGPATKATSIRISPAAIARAPALDFGAHDPAGDRRRACAPGAGRDPPRDRTVTPRSGRAGKAGVGRPPSPKGATSADGRQRQRARDLFP